MLEWVLDSHFDPYPDQSDADPDPSFQIKAQNLKIVLNRLIFIIFWLVIAK